jgi:hypothetical protein
LRDSEIYLLAKTAPCTRKQVLHALHRYSASRQQMLPLISASTDSGCATGQRADIQHRLSAHIFEYYRGVQVWARVQRCDLRVSCVLLIHAGRRKNGLPLVADDKGKATKKKNLQVTAMLTLRLPIAKFHPLMINCIGNIAQAPLQANYGPST